MTVADYLVYICFHFPLFLGWDYCLLQDKLEHSIPRYTQHNSSRIPLLAKYIVDLITVALNKGFGYLLSE